MSPRADSPASLRVIVGPTAAGKSALALALAARFGGAIIGADSRQIYRGFDIGTGKPSRDDAGRIPHSGIDVADPSERWSAARFAAAAAGWIDTAIAGGRTPVVVGGTGFWVSALVAPLAPVPALEPGRRAELAASLAALSEPRLREWCVALDPALGRRGPAQWRRAIEVALFTGRRLSDWHALTPRLPQRAVRYLVLDPGRALDDRIAARVDAMFAGGWVAEVRALMTSVPQAAVAWKACGYERIRDAILANEPAEATRDQVVQETRQYARRQRTWFRRQLAYGPVTRLDPLAEDAWPRAEAWWQGENDA